MIRKRAIIEVSVLLDPVPGWGHESEDHVRFLRDKLNVVYPWYKPQVKLIEVKEVDE